MSKQTPRGLLLNWPLNVFCLNLLFTVLPSRTYDLIFLPPEMYDYRICACSNLVQNEWVNQFAVALLSLIMQEYVLSRIKTVFCCFYAITAPQTLL